MAPSVQSAVDSCWPTRLPHCLPLMRPTAPCYKYIHAAGRSCRTHAAHAPRFCAALLVCSRYERCCCCCCYCRRRSRRQKPCRFHGGKTLCTDFVKKCSDKPTAFSIGGKRRSSYAVRTGDSELRRQTAVHLGDSQLAPCCLPQNSPLRAKACKASACLAVRLTVRFLF